MSREETFWNRVIELSKKTFKKEIFDYFVLTSRLIKVDQQEAIIYLDAEVKKLFWEENMTKVILTAGFEIYAVELTISYQFNLEEEEEEKEFVPLSETNRDYAVSHTPIIDLPPIQTGLKKKYTFDNFVSGDGNQWALAAALAVSENLATTYNPLFIYGGPGLGKTHLLNAIGNQIMENYPNARVKYIPAESFINEFLERLRLNDMDTFKKTYRNLDLLLIDDIQSLGGKKVTTQEEFFNTFNALYGDNKQIVLTSDRSPDHLDSLEERLVTRFKWGLTQNITPPDFETRIAILRNKIEDLDFTFPDDTLEYLAGQFDSNVRDLEGALNDISLVARVKKIKDITIDVAAEAIRARKNESLQITVIPIEKIQAEVGKFYNVSVNEMKGTRRVQNIVLARQVAMYLAREMTDNSLPRIGREFGGKDHTTVMHAYEKIKGMIEIDDNLRLEIQTIKKKLK
ncbi:chromosomal replication initiator protein DnaA [Streptococcus ilei]|uniref:Chromosomal replication initiator protein DnaA n=1 Tax=Streptococcus koreensis TaxID=2382163 RepID=A0ABN5PTM2_9STRE|nr:MULTISPECIES: chromosomal replication initiator protein DnaA [Streptococcus]AGY39116.1 chromosomal replication initiation protein DnaA [Streptococcus ilei]AGY40570.1 chromosomal replication initiation protein DnaA [Streptococcus ilei]AYF93653.1 chromosomal replication initiator protein DnaA [Streptococcus koreensis]MDB8651010.1 chromosomal replication initiator protein DnaA [Streptococcus australis]